MNSKLVAEIIFSAWSITLKGQIASLESSSLVYYAVKKSNLPLSSFEIIRRGRGRKQKSQKRQKTENSKLSPIAIYSISLRVSTNKQHLSSTPRQAGHVSWVVLKSC